VTARFDVILQRNRTLLDENVDENVEIDLWGQIDALASGDETFRK
jgi:hypothetical protein